MPPSGDKVILAFALPAGPNSHVVPARASWVGDSDRDGVAGWTGAWGSFRTDAGAGAGVGVGVWAGAGCGAGSGLGVSPLTTWRLLTGTVPYWLENVRVQPV